MEQRLVKGEIGLLTQTVVKYMSKEDKDRAIRERLDWINQCEQMLLDIATGAKVKNYQIGSRSLTRYDVSVNQIKTLIDGFEEDLAVLDGSSNGRYMGRFICVDE